MRKYIPGLVSRSRSSSD